ncbi:unnamed protein product [Urochloa humidicola]
MAETALAALYTLLCLVGVVILLLKLTKTAFSRRGAAGGLNLPPGPWPLPVIGNMHSLLGALPHHAMRRLAQRHGAVMLLRLGYVPTVVVSSPEAAREVLKTHDGVVSDRTLYVTADILSYGGQNIAFAPSGSRQWKEIRRLCATELLSPKRVLSFRPIREEAAASLVRSVAATAASSPAAVNLSERIKVLMNDILMRCAVGDTCPMRDEYMAGLDEVLRLLAGFNLVDLFPGSRLARTLGAGSLRAAREVHERVNRIVLDIIQDHESKQGSDDDDGDGGGRRDDILDVLLRLQRDGGLDTVLTTEVVCAVLFVSHMPLSVHRFSPLLVTEKKKTVTQILNKFLSGCFRCGFANIEIALASLLYHFNWNLPNGANPCELDMTEAYGITARRKNELFLEATPFVPISQ